MSHMTIGSCKEFHDNVLDLILAATAADLHIEALEPAYSQAVAQLAGIVNRQHEYSKETAEIKGMLGVLQAEDNQAAVSLLGLDDEVTALAEANAAFEAAFKGKQQEKSTRMDVEDLESEQVVGQANALYEQIVQTVNAYAIVQPTDKLLAFIDDLNGVVGVYADIVDGTTSDGSTPDGSGSTDPEPTPEPGGEDEGEGGSPL